MKEEGSFKTLTPGFDVLKLSFLVNKLECFSIVSLSSSVLFFVSKATVERLNSTARDRTL